MATGTSNLRVWNPSKGIIFASPRASKSVPAVPDSRTLNTAVPPEGGASSPRSIPKSFISSSNGTGTAAIETDVEGKATDSGENDAVESESEAAIAGPHAALEWKLSEELFLQAKKARPGSAESFWSYQLYRGPAGEDGIEQKVKVHYCRTKHTAERVCQDYFMNEKVIGFDLEWAPDSGKWSGVRRNVSLIQLASPSRIALFHVAVFAKGDDLVPPTFKKIMENAEITKVGVWIKGDATRIRTHMGIDSKGLMEISHLYKLVTYSQTGQYKDINKRLIPLATQVQHILQLPMFKGQNVRSSDWTRQLRMDQIIYSASDAYAGVQLYAALEHARKQLDPCPPRPHHAELNLPIRLADGIDLDTSDEEAEPPAEASAQADVTSTTTTTAPPAESSPTARRRQLKAYLKTVKESTRSMAETILEAEAALIVQPPKPREPKDPRLGAAEAWAAAFKAENYPNPTTTTVVPTEEDEAPPKAAGASAGGGTGGALGYELRAYHIWHTHKELKLEEVASLLRKPPLKPDTVANYIFSAVKKESLPVDQTRWQQQIIGPRLRRMGGLRGRTTTSVWTI